MNKNFSPVAKIIFTFFYTEFLDDVQIDACNKHSGLKFAVQPTIFLEFHGSEQEVTAQAELVCKSFTLQADASHVRLHIPFAAEIFTSNGGSSFEWSHETEERERLWKARHEIYYANLALRPACKVLHSAPDAL